MWPSYIINIYTSLPKVLESCKVKLKEYAQCGFLELMKVIIQNVIEAKTWNSIQIIGICYAEAHIHLFIFAILFFSPPSIAF